MRFKVDENLHPDATAFLRSHGHDTVTVWDQGLRGRPDADVSEAARSEGRILLTLDVGFADIRTYPPERYPGIICLRLARQGRESVLGVLPRILAFAKKEPPVARLWVVDESTIRVRGGLEAR